jgi:hypothetical protein
MTNPPFPAQQVDGAIRAGLRGSRQNYNLTAVEAQEKSSTYRDSLTHYRSVAQRCLNEGDYLQAAEKSWGAYAQAVKAAGAGYGIHVNTHRSVLRVAEEFTALAATVNAADAGQLRIGYLSARSLHQHFYESDLGDAEVEQGVADVMDAIDLLQTLFERR